MEFTYNASACAAGGVIQKRNGEFVVIPSLASVALAPTGGGGMTTLKDYHSEAVSFTSAHTEVFGREVAPMTFTTQTDVYITNLRVFDVLSIALLRATVTSTRRVDPANPHDDDHAFDLEASYHGVEVWNRAAGRRQEVSPKVDVSVKSIKRYQHLQSILDGPGNAEFTAADGTRLLPCADKKMLLKRFNADVDTTLKHELDQKNPILGTLIEDVESAVTRNERVARTHGKLHKLFIPNFGTVRFGELMLKPGRRRVNLLRIELMENELAALQGDEDEPFNEAVADYQGGSLAMGSVEGNGSPLFP
jgi:hypothetical protein